MEPNRVQEGASSFHVVLEGSGFTTTSLARLRVSPDPFSPPMASAKRRDHRLSLHRGICL
jgi:hypothetical protein